MLRSRTCLQAKLQRCHRTIQRTWELLVTPCGHGCCRRSSSDLYKGLDACAVGDTIELEVLRQDSRERVPIILEPSS
jgi:hypothetical protein